jgi:hypothetical protein
VGHLAMVQKNAAGEALLIGKGFQPSGASSKCWFMPWTRHKRRRRSFPELGVWHCQLWSCLSWIGSGFFVGIPQEVNYDEE